MTGRFVLKPLSSLRCNRNRRLSRLQDLAYDIVMFYWDFDTYEFKDSYETLENAYALIYDDLLKGGSADIILFLREIVEDEDCLEHHEFAMDLIRRLEELE